MDCGLIDVHTGDVVVLALAAHCPQLTDAGLSSQPLMSEAAQTVLVQRGRRLKTLTLDQRWVNAETWMHLIAAKGARSLLFIN